MPGGGTAVLADTDEPFYNIGRARHDEYSPIPIHSKRPPEGGLCQICMRCDQASRSACLRYAIKPTPQNPRIIIAQV